MHYKWTAFDKRNMLRCNDQMPKHTHTQHTKDNRWIRSRRNEIELYERRYHDSHMTAYICGTPKSASVSHQNNCIICSYVSSTEAIVRLLWRTRGCDCRRIYSRMQINLWRSTHSIPLNSVAPNWTFCANCVTTTAHKSAYHTLCPSVNEHIRKHNLSIQ